MVDKVAVVTGSNKGLGFGIVRQLCKRVRIVYLTSRDINKGINAVEELKKEGLNPIYHQLDVANEENVTVFAEQIKYKHGGIDILINNAGVICKELKTTYEDAKYVININYESYFHVMKHLFPLLKDSARVVNISSDCGHITNLKNEYWIEKLINSDVTIEDVDSFVNWFLDTVKNGTLNENYFITPYLLSYRVSKVAVCALTRIQQREIGREISINSLHPGFVKTNMTSNFGEMTIEEASEAPIYLALDCDQSVKGKFIWFDKSEVDWADKNFEHFSKNIEQITKMTETIYEHKYANFKK